MRSWLIASLMCFAAWTIGPGAHAQTLGDPRCVKLCVVVLQAVGDDIKEQIYLQCNQTDGTCEGSGHIQLADERVPVLLTSNLEDGRLNLRIKTAGDSFAPEEADRIVMDIDPTLPRQAGQFVVRRVPSRVDTPLFLTVVVEQLLPPQE